MVNNKLGYIIGFIICLFYHINQYDISLNYFRSYHIAGLIGTILFPLVISFVIALIFYRKRVFNKHGIVFFYVSLIVFVLLPFINYAINTSKL